MSSQHPEVITLQLGELNTNCYIAYCPDTLEAVVIDPADAGDVISEEILRNNLILTTTLLTHGHFDHVLGVLELKLNFDDMPIFLHQDDAFLIAQAQKNAEYWLKHPVNGVPKPSNWLKEGTTFTFGNCSLKTITTPGHTPGSVTFVSEVSPDDIKLFVGDTLFKNGVGRTDFQYSSSLELEKSLKKLLSYPPNTEVFPGHGDSTTISAERIHLDYQG